MVYKVIRVELTNDAEVVTVGKRATTFQTPHQLNIGGLYFLRPHKLYRVLALVE